MPSSPVTLPPNATGPAASPLALPTTPSAAPGAFARELDQVSTRPDASSAPSVRAADTGAPKTAPERERAQASSADAKANAGSGAEASDGSRPASGTEAIAEGRSANPGNPRARDEAGDQGGDGLAALLAGIVNPTTVPAPDPAGARTAAATAAPLRQGPPARAAVAPDRARGVTEAAGQATLAPPAADRPAPFESVLARATGPALAAASESRPSAEATNPAPQPLLPAAAMALGLGLAGAAPAAAPAEARLPVPFGAPEFAPALAVQVSLLVRNGVQEARLHLNPAEMGPITVQIAVEGSAARVSMSAEQAPTRQALEQAMPVLASALRDAGLTLTGGGVFEQPRQPQREGAPTHQTGAGDAVGGDADAAAAAPEPTRARTLRGVVDVFA
jgi:flagellar hook-length control protein FliK